MKSLTCFSSRSRGTCCAVILERLAENCRGRTTAIICTRTNAPKYILESQRLHFGSICDQNGRNFEPWTDHFHIATMIKSCGHIPFYRRWRAAWRAGWWEGPSQWVSALSVWTCSGPWCSALLEARHWPSPGRQKTASLVFTTQKCSSSLKEAVMFSLTLWRASTCKSWNSDVSSLIEWLARMTDRTPKPWCLMRENTSHLLTHLYTHVIFVIIQNTPNMQLIHSIHVTYYV